MGSSHPVRIDDELLALPDATGHPQPTIYNLGVAFVGGFDGEEHAETVFAAVDLLGVPW